MQKLVCCAFLRLLYIEVAIDTEVSISVLRYRGGVSDGAERRGIRRGGGLDTDRPRR